MVLPKPRQVLRIWVQAQVPSSPAEFSSGHHERNRHGKQQSVPQNSPAAAVSRARVAPRSIRHMHAGSHTHLIVLITYLVSRNLKCTLP